ncbi:MAG TPA: helix-turn-helix domain-containing protein [Acidimicrobiales bacterium]|nr:helix-turn-helix domain-containing protein [Acidimicrobiales bacterium]
MARTGKSDGGRREGPFVARNATEMRDLRDPRTLRAMAHPVRLELLEALGIEGPLTATQAAELIGETPTTCSFHLRQLEKYGFVEDVGQPGARERPWRLTNIGSRIPEDTGDSAIDLAAGALTRMFLERSIGRIRDWFDNRQHYPSAWRQLTGLNETVWFVTAEELAELMNELEPLMFRFTDRIADPSKRPAGAMPVEVLIFSYLMRFTGKD